jgi:hypothetical protein
LASALGAYSATRRASRSCNDKGLGSRADRADIEPRQIEHGLEQLLECLDGTLDFLQHGGCLVARLCLKLPDEQRQRVNGLPQVVACRREEARLGLIRECEIACALRDSRFLFGVGLLNLRRHPIELRGEGRKLVVGAYLDPTIEPALTQLARPCFDFANGSHHSPRKQQAPSHCGGDAEQHESHRPCDGHRPDGRLFERLFREHRPAEIGNQRRRHHAQVHGVRAARDGDAFVLSAERLAHMRQRRQVGLAEDQSDVRMRDQVSAGSTT